MGKAKKTTAVYEAEREISAQQAQRILGEAAKQRAADCQEGIDKLLKEMDCYQCVVQIHKPGQSFYRIITEARVRA